MTMQVEITVTVREADGTVAAHEASASLILQGQEREDVIISRANEVATRVVERLDAYDVTITMAKAQEEKDKLVAEETQILDTKVDDNDKRRQ